jgi:hypothetical protein
VQGAALAAQPATPIERQHSAGSCAPVASYLTFDHSTPAGAVKAITHLLRGSRIGSLFTGDGCHERSRRYIRVVIDIPRDSWRVEEKQELLRRTIDCCVEYEGRHANECEIEVQLNEVDERDVMRAGVVAR